MSERRPLRPFSRAALAALAAACLVLPGPLADFIPDVPSRLAPSAQAADITVNAGDTETSTETTADNINVDALQGSGAASLTISNDIDVSGRASVGAGPGTTSGAGNNATLTVNGTLTARGSLEPGSTSLSVASGSLENGNRGGTASFTANTLVAPSIALYRNDGNLAFNVDTLDVTSGNTRLLLGNTTVGSSSTGAGGDGVYIGTARLGDGELSVQPLFLNGDARIGTLELVGSGSFNDTDNPIELGKLALNGGTLNAANWSGIVDHAYDDTAIELKSGGGTVNLGAGEDKDLSRVLEGAGSLTKTGAGVLTLSGANTYSGATNINGGTLRLENINAAGNTSGFATTANTTLELAFAGTFDKTVSGAGGVTTDPGAGNAVTLSGTNAYTGMTTVRSGTLALGGSLASNQLTLYGGTTFDRKTFDHSLDGGILNVEGSNGQSATYTGDLSAKNATLNFISPINPTQPLLTVSGNADVSNSAYNVGLSGGTQLAAGSQLTLLEVTGTGNTLTANNLTKGGGIIQIGSTVAHDITANTAIDPSSGRLVVDVSQGRATEQAKALSEGFLGGMALSLQGADLVAGKGMESAARSAGSAGADGTGFAGFGALSGGSLRYNTGSHVDMRSLSLLAGLAWGVDLAPGRLTLGAFFEYGNGSYNTHNSFSNAADVDGDGNTHYLGGGILARMDFANSGPGRFYAEASGRMGNTHNEYDSSDLRDAAGRTADYDSDSPYYGLHLGAGYLWEINEKASLDLHGKYFWTRQQSNSVNLSTGEDLSFKDADSIRLRFGGRFAYAVNEHVSPYLGAAWEHEFDGRARATTNGYDIDAPNLRGDTGIGEVGLSLTPSVDLPLTVDLGVQGYTGKREGVTGSLQVKFEF